MISPHEFFSSLDSKHLFWSGLGAWCIYQLLQALRCIYYIVFEPWVVEEDEDD